MDRKYIAKIVSASMLGDGTLRMFENGQNPAYALAQVDRHEDYISFVSGVVGNLTKVTVHHEVKKTDANGVNHQGCLRLRSACHPFLKDLWERWYSGGRKTVSLHDMKQFDWEMAAIWYMDDGYLLDCKDNAQRGNVCLCTDCFNEVEVVMLQKIIYNHLGVAFNIRRRGYRKDGSRVFRLVATNDNEMRFLDGVRPFILDSFQYKVRTVGPSNEGGEIVQ
jgi:hypothetical protein